MIKPYGNAVIFAGGKSARMGKDKALLPFGESNSLSHFQFEKLNTLFNTVYISAKSDKFDFEVDLIKDRYPEDSPLVGLLSIFESAEVENVFILAVDSPFVNKAVISKLMAQENDAYDAVIAKSPSGLQPLCGLYKKSIVPFVSKQYAKGDHKLTTLLSLANTLVVDFEEDALFANLNHPKEYQAALVHYKANLKN